MANYTFGNVVLLGDSLTEHSFDQIPNWGGLLFSFLIANLVRSDIINRGVSGYTTSDIKRDLTSMFQPKILNDVACMTLMIGTNDSIEPRVSLDDYKKNLLEIIDYIIKKGINKDKLILITPPTNLRSAERTKKYSEAMIAIAKNLGITVLDLFELTNRKENINRAFVGDGVHFSKAGAEMVFNLIKDEVLKRAKIYYQKN